MDTNTLRELSRAASKAPWNTCSACHKPDGKPCGLIWSHGDDVLVAAAHGEDMVDTHGDPYPGDPLRKANAALIVALRNDAEKYADLREAVEAYRKATDMRETLAAEGNRSEYAVACVNETNAYRAMLAALAALGGED